MTELVVDDPGRPRRKRVATIAKRGKTESDLTDATCTPKSLADMLPETDFDPCSNPRSHIRARWSWSLEKGYDGLKMPWRGTGFINWPFSNPMPWATKAMHELDSGRCSDLIVLCKFDPSTRWWKKITEHVARSSFDTNTPIALPDLWMFDDRIQFDEHPEIIARRRDDYAAAVERGEKPKGRQDGMSTSNFVSVILHHRYPDAPPLELRSVAKLWRQVP